MFQIAIPVLHVGDSSAATEFYCSGPGFHQEFAYRPFGGADPCYMGLSRDEARLHLSSFPVMVSPAVGSFWLLTMLMGCTVISWPAALASTSRRRTNHGEIERCT